jgi:hypothetical protein
MPKILYIEDELTKNISTIQKLFAPVLKDKRINTELSELESSDRFYAEDVIMACRYCSELDVVHSFPLAVKKVLSYHKSYDLIVIDRNLGLHGYDDQLQEISSMIIEAWPQFHADRLLDYFEREGDLLLLLLMRINPDYKDKTYYLTANASDALRGSSELQTMLDMNSFADQHIIEKGSTAEQRICDILKDMKAFRIQNSYRTHCDILRARLSEEDVNQFVKMVGYHMADKKSEFLFALRKLLDNLLHHIAYQIGELDAGYWNDKNKKQLQAKSFIKGFKEGSSFIGLPGTDQRYHIGYNSIIRNACLSIFEISSDCGIHELSKAIDIESLSTASLSKHTMQSLLSQICDVIIWYDVAMAILAAR